MSFINFRNVTIKYPIYNTRSLSLRNQLIRITTGGILQKEAGQIQTVTALNNLNFNLRDGDSVGLIGHNGSGKSTLLRAMAGIYHPFIGSVSCSGRVATLFELGAGADLDLSGYENIIRVSLFMGLNTREAKRNIPDIENFAQLGDFLQLPVRTYSSGMLTRLLFAIATSVNPDILLVDEIFQTGDAEFQARAKERMQRFIKAVGIFVFASHDLHLIKTNCNRFFRLEHGLLRELSREELPEE